MSLGKTHWGESEIRGPVHLFRERLMLRLFCPLLSGGRVLDAGCGSGSLAFDLSQLGYKVNMVEYSPEFVESVADRTRTNNKSAWTRVQRASVTQLPFLDSSFDGIVCGEVLEHVLPEDGGDLAAIGQFARVLRPGGIIVASVPLNPCLWDISDEWALHVKRYVREEFLNLFSENGFEVRSVRVWGFPLGRLYHRYIFKPWLNRVRKQTVVQRENRCDTRLGRSRILVNSAANLFRFDEMFSHLPWGRGVVVAAQRVVEKRR
jgi:2-polyprenyl-3-methyl-5-hydroxy-6-metoxy-1,4-benzoquinol methylase